MEIFYEMEPHKIFITNLYVIAIFFFFFINYRRKINVNDIFYLIDRSEMGKNCIFNGFFFYMTK